MPTKGVQSQRRYEMKIIAIFYEMIISFFKKDIESPFIMDFSDSDDYSKAYDIWMRTKV